MMKYVTVCKDCDPTSRYNILYFIILKDTSFAVLAEDRALRKSVEELKMGVHGNRSLVQEVKTVSNSNRTMLKEILTMLSGMKEMTRGLDDTITFKGPLL